MWDLQQNSGSGAGATGWGSKPAAPFPPKAASMDPLRPAERWKLEWNFFAYQSLVLLSNLVTL